ncbi:MAG: NAD(P)/FAD-dependent oxidoreductase [archaeon]|nr:NAD(P)/FAD-dependent oxidoreductase [archaeon]
MPDITVVGGGPAGTFSAKQLAISGHEVTLLEEHRTSGIPTHCAGVVSNEVIKTLGLPSNLTTSMLTTADVVLPNGKVISTSKSSPYAYVIDRAACDIKMAEDAEAAGVNIKYGVSYKSHVVTDDYVSVSTNTETIKSDLLIGADGQSSLIAASLGNNHARSYIRGFQVDLEHELEDQNKMTMWLGNNVAPGFFAWQLPLGNVTRMGIGVRASFGTPSQYLENLLKTTGLDEKKRLKTYVGKIPIGGRRTSYSDRILLIGDAAGQVKPVSGGGLFPIAKVAPLLRETVDRAYSLNIFNASVLSLYERAWKREIGKSLNNGMRLRNFYDSLDDDDLCRFGELFNRPDVLEELSEIDIDNPSNVVKPILKKKGMKSALFKSYLGTRL